MKKLVLTLALGIACASAALAQGTINFASAAPGCQFLTTNSAGVRATGPAYMADFYYGANGAAESSLVGLHLPANFNTGAQAGYFTGGPRTIPGFSGGTTVEGQVRIWSANLGSTWEQAVANGATIPGDLGKTILFTISLATSPGTPSVMTGLNGASVQLVSTVVPEPATVALAGLGAAALMIFRRRK